MKKLLALAAMTLAASNALAGVKLVVRSDYVNTPSYDNASGTENESTSLFTPAVARMYLMGNVGDAVIDSGFNLRQFVPSSISGNVEKVMTVDKFVDHLFISKSMDAWTFSAGKLWMNVGGFERRASWDGDTYLTSLANGGAGGIASGSTGTVGSITNVENSSGVAAAYKINDDHKVEFQLSNQTNRDSQLLTSENKRHSMGVAYWGSFADKMVMPYISYTSGAADTTTEGFEQTFLAAGFRINPMENLGLDLEYLANSEKKRSTGDKDETTSTILEARYKMGTYVPVVKYEMSADKVAGNDNFKRNAFAVALEVVPKADEAFRYHVAYTSIKDDFDSAASEDVTFNTLTVGIKYAGDIAK